MHYLIIGAGAAGLSAAETIRKYDTGGKITILTNEEFEPYSLCALPSYLADVQKENDLVRFNKRWWKDNKIELKRNTEVKGVDPGSKTVKLAKGGSLKFDKLLVATGSRPIIPDIPGNDLEGIFNLNSLADSKRINDWLCGLGDCRKASAVVIGGGFIGLESAIALRQRGLSVTIIEMLEGVLPRMVDSDVNRLIIKTLKREGVDVKVGCRVKSIEGDGRVSAVNTTRGRLKTDMVVWCVGVRPNIEFLENSGIAINGGITVNSRMQTNFNDIYAAGDVINSPDLISGEEQIHANWPNALEQGTVAGANMASHPSKYVGAFNLNVINVFEVPVVSLGLHTEDHKRLFGKKYRSYTRRYGMDNNPKLNRVIFAGGRFTGFQSVGWPANIGWLTTLLRTGNEIPDTEEVRTALLNDDLKFKVLTKLK